MAPSKRFSNTYSYSYITKLATSVTHLCPKVISLELNLLAGNLLYFAYLFTRSSLNRWLNQANKKYKQRISHCLGPTGHNQGYGVRAASQVLSDLG